MKYMTPLAAILSLVLVAADCSAQPPGRRGDRDKAGPGQRGEIGRDGGRRGPGGPGGDPAQFVARMMKEFDKDGDSKLDVKELTSMLTAMRERRGQGGRGPGEGRGPRDGQRPGEGRGPRGKDGQKPGGRRGDGERGNKPGGEKPKRPAAE